MITEVTEDYVSFEIAKLLKEKGFDEKCQSAWLYNPRKDNSEYFVEYLAKGTENNTELEYFNEPDTDWAYSAPTLQMVMKWLREVYGLHICIFIGEDFSCDADGNTVDMWHFWSYYITNLCSDIVYDAYDKLDCVEYQSFEEACEASIKYCLENLI